MSTSKRLIPLLNRIVVEKLVQSNKTVGGIMLPESALSKIQEGRVIAAGPGLKTKDGNTIPVSLKEGDMVLLPNYGGTEVKMGDKDLVVYNEEDILAKME